MHPLSLYVPPTGDAKAHPTGEDSVLVSPSAPGVTRGHTVQKSVLVRVPLKWCMMHALRMHSVFFIPFVPGRFAIYCQSVDRIDVDSALFLMISVRT